MEKFPRICANEIFNLLFVKTKNTNSADLIFKFGERFFYSCGVDKDINVETFCFKKLINLKTENIFDRLNINIAKIYLSGNADVEKIKKLKTYRQRAQNCDEAAIKIISEIYSYGIYKNKALEYLRRTADSGFIFAKKKLADFYAAGKFVKKNEAAAISLYKESLDFEDPRTQIEIMCKIA